MNYLYHRKKPEVWERKTHIAKTIVVFGIVIKPVDGSILIIQDDPVKGNRRRWEDFDSKYKLTGGKVPRGIKSKDFIQQKIREESKVSSIHLDVKRKTFFTIEESPSLVIHFYLMRYVQGEPFPGKNIKFANFLSLREIKQKMKDGKFLNNHKLALEKYFKIFKPAS